MARTSSKDWLLRQQVTTVTGSFWQNFVRLLAVSGVMALIVAAVVIPLAAVKNLDYASAAGVIVGAFVGGVAVSALTTGITESQMNRIVRPTIKRLRIDAETWVTYVRAQNKRTLPYGDFNKQAFIEIAKVRIKYIHENRYRSAVFLVLLGLLNIWLGLTDGFSYVNVLIGIYVIVIGLLQPLVTIPRIIKRLEFLQRRAEQSESGV